MCNEGYKQSSEKTKNNSEHEKNDSTKTWVSWVYSLMLETYIHRLKKYIPSGHVGKIFCDMGRIPIAFIPFLPFENVFPNSLINS